MTGGSRVEDSCKIAHLAAGNSRVQGPSQRPAEFLGPNLPP